MNPDDEMNPAFGDAVWQVLIVKGRPMIEDKASAPLVFDRMPTVMVGDPDASGPVHEVLYGPVLLHSDAEYLNISVPVSVTRREVENQPPTDLRSTYRTKIVREMHHPIFAFCDYGISANGFEESSDGCLTLARWEIQPFGAEL